MPSEGDQIRVAVSNISLRGIRFKTSRRNDLSNSYLPVTVSFVFRNESTAILAESAILNESKLWAYACYCSLSRPVLIVVSDF
jgi:hypothetical protein